MKIAIDTSALVINSFSGLAKVVRNLVHNICLVDTTDQLNLFLNYFIGNSLGSQLDFPHTVKHVFRLPRRLVELWWRLGWPPFDSMLRGMDVFHSLHISVPPTRKTKTILTVHDCRYLSHPELYHEKEVTTYRNRMEVSLNRVDMLCAVSEFTRQELIDHFNLSSERVKVIYNGFVPYRNSEGKSKNLIENYMAKNNLPNSYLFYIGTLDPRKNLSRLIQAMAQCRKAFHDFPHLLIAGIDKKDWHKSDIKTLTEELGLTSRIRLCGLIEEDLLVELTQRALALCYPSIYEGFGYPPLEAMSLGVPVLAGNSSSIPEVTGNAACLVDPWDVNDIARGLGKIIYSSGYRQKLVLRGLKQIKKFPWSKSAAEYIRLYKEALS